MRKLVLFACALAFAAFAHPASAQTKDQNAPDTASALIAQFGVGDLFEPIEDDHHIVVRHRASGLTCHFFGEERQRSLIVFTGDLPRGEDVGCAAEKDGQATTLYATRYAPPITAQQALASANAAIRNRFPDAQAIDAALTMSTDGLPPYMVQNFLVTINGERHLTSALIAEANGWIFKLRFTARAVEDDALMRIQLEAGAMFMAALTDLRGEAAAPAPQPRDAL